MKHLLFCLIPPSLRKCPVVLYTFEPVYQRRVGSCPRTGRKRIKRSGFLAQFHKPANSGEKNPQSLILISRMIPVQKETAISKLKAQLETYPEIKCSLDDMADTAFISKYNLIRTFKHEIGLTPHQFQLQNRIRKAQRLLENSATIAEVALATGFCDQSHFIRHFEKIVGLTPTDYRLACKAALPVSAD